MKRKLFSWSILTLSLLLITLPTQAEDSSRNSTVTEKNNPVLVDYIAKGINATNTGQIDQAIKFFAQASDMVPISK